MNYQDLIDLLDHERKAQGISKSEMARRLETSCASLNRTLNPDHRVSVRTLERSAAILGLRIGYTLDRCD